MRLVKIFSIMALTVICVLPSRAQQQSGIPERSKLIVGRLVNDLDIKEEKAIRLLQIIGIYGDSLNNNANNPVIDSKTRGLKAEQLYIEQRAAVEQLLSPEEYSRWVEWGNERKRRRLETR